jgi:hypothetical protein
MKARTVIYVSILFLAITILFAEDVKNKISDEDFMEAWSGTWINTDYRGDMWQKMINYPDGTAEGFGILTSTIAGLKRKITILEWLDSKGTIWYRVRWDTFRPSKRTGYEMGKISDSGNTWEYIWAGEDHPIEEWEPDRFEYNYKIYYRQ